MREVTESSYIDPVRLTIILKGLFPNLILFDNKWPGVGYDQMDICRLIQMKKINYEDKFALVFKMKDNKYFAPLFPKDNMAFGFEWEELRDSINDGCPVIDFFIEKLNKKFIEGFNSTVIDEIKLSDPPKIDVVKLFIKTVFGKKALFIEQLNDPKALNICEHSPYSLYKAYEYFAHKQYTLFRLEKEFPVEDIHKRHKSDLKDKISNATKSSNFYALNANGYYINFLENYEKIFMELKESKPELYSGLDIINKLFIENLKCYENLQMKTKNTKTEKPWVLFISNVRIMIDKILESKADNYDNYYKPADFITLTGQIGGQIGHENYKNPSEDSSSEISFYELKRENEEGEIIEYDPQEEKYHDSGNELIIKADRELFASKFLKSRFNAADEEDFIKFVAEEGNWAAIVDELNLYFNGEGSDLKNKVLYNIYSGERSRISPRLFKEKIRKALFQYKEYLETLN